jgi:hypothetical protein
VQPVVSNEPCPCPSPASPRWAVGARGRGARAQGWFGPAAQAPARSVRPCVGSAAANSGSGAAWVGEELSIGPPPFRLLTVFSASAASVFLRLLTGHAHGTADGVGSYQ